MKKIIWIVLFLVILFLNAKIFYANTIYYGKGETSDAALLPQEYFKLDNKYHNWTWDMLEQIMPEVDFKTLRHYVMVYENSETNDNYNAVCNILSKYTGNDAQIVADYLINYAGTRVFARYFIDSNLNATFHPIKGLTNSSLTPSEEWTFQSMWQYIKALIPEKDLHAIEMIIIDTDGTSSTMATIFTLNKQYSSAVLTCDIYDYYRNQEFLKSIIHEYGHLLTLNATQCDESILVNKAGIGPLIFNEKTYNYLPDYENSGRKYCDSSYITYFYNAYWTKFVNERDLEKITSQFKTKYINSGEFISELSMKNVREDIAESFSYFVLNDPPEGNEIWKQKVLYFYRFPELVEKRAYIRTALSMQ